MCMKCTVTPGAKATKSLTERVRPDGAELVGPPVTSFLTRQPRALAGGRRRVVGIPRVPAGHLRLSEGLQRLRLDVSNLGGGEVRIHLGLAGRVAAGEDSLIVPRDRP